VLVATKQDRPSRFLFHFADLLQQAKRDDWSLVITDIDIDTRTFSIRPPFAASVAR